jgi:hypothetical protein
VDSTITKASAIEAAKAMLKDLPPEGVKQLAELGIIGELLCGTGRDGVVMWLMQLVETAKALPFAILVTGGDSPSYELHNRANPAMEPLLIDGEKAAVMRLHLQSIQNKLGARGLPVPTMPELILASMLSTLIDAARTM